MAINIPTPTEALTLLNGGLLPDFAGLSVDGTAETTLTDLLSAAIDIIEFTNHVIDPDFFTDILSDPECYEGSGVDKEAVAVAVWISDSVAEHLSEVAEADENADGDEPIGHELVRALRVAIISVGVSDTEDQLDIIRLSKIASTDAQVMVFGQLSDRAASVFALGLSLFTFGLISAHFYPESDTDGDGRDFVAYMDAIASI